MLSFFGKKKVIQKDGLDHVILETDVAIGSRESRITGKKEDCVFIIFPISTLEDMKCETSYVEIEVEKILKMYEEEEFRRVGVNEAKKD